jgi:hypothetical protein
MKLSSKINVAFVAKKKEHQEDEPGSLLFLKSEKFIQCLRGDRNEFFFSAIKNVSLNHKAFNT